MRTGSGDQEQQQQQPFLDWLLTFGTLPGRMHQTSTYGASKANASSVITICLIYECLQYECYVLLCSSKCMSDLIYIVMSVIAKWFHWWFMISLRPGSHLGVLEQCIHALRIAWMPKGPKAQGSHGLRCRPKSSEIVRNRPKLGFLGFLANEEVPLASSVPWAADFGWLRYRVVNLLHACSHMFTLSGSYMFIYVHPV